MRMSLYAALMSHATTKRKLAKRLRDKAAIADFDAGLFELAARQCLKLRRERGLSVFGMPERIQERRNFPVNGAAPAAH